MKPLNAAPKCVTECNVRCYVQYVHLRMGLRQTDRQTDRQTLNVNIVHGTHHIKKYYYVFCNYS